MLHFSWYCSCLVPLHPLRFSMLYTTSSIMLSNRLFYSIFYSSLDHTSLFRLRHPMLKVLLHCGLLIYAFLLYSLLFHALLLQASLSHALLLTLCCYISRCLILCCSTIATPLFPVPCTRLHACVLCSNLHWSIVYRPILRWFMPSFSVLCCPMRCGFTFDWPILAAWFVASCLFAASLLRALCCFMLYVDLCFILIHAWFFSLRGYAVVCLAVSCALLVLRMTIPHCSELRCPMLYALLFLALLFHASLSLVLLLMLCSAVSSVAALCFTAPSLLSHAATSSACRCFILCCSMLCCFMIATPLFSVPPCTFLLACVLCSKFHWSIVYRPILRLCLLRCFILFFSMVRCPMLCGFTHDWPILHCFMPRFSMLCCASCFTVPAVLYAPMFRAYLLHAYADLCLMLRHALCCFMLYTNPCLMLLPPVMLFHASLFHAHFSYFAALYFTGPYLSALLFHALMFYCSMLCCSMLWCFSAP